MLTDVYSFGVLLWELISGEYPWLGQTNVQIIFQVAVKGERLPLPPVEGEPPADAHSASDRDAAGGPARSSSSSAGALRRSSGGGGGGGGGYYSALPAVPASVRDLIAACFAHSPAARPDMSAVLGVINAALMEMDLREAAAAQSAAAAAAAAAAAGSGARLEAGSAGGAAIASGSASAGGAASASAGGGGTGPSGAASASAGGAETGAPSGGGAAPTEADAAQQLATPFFNIGFDFD
ncbi:hypothetical protein HYH02_010605 [Chlamydomonas schloesseri]|uniref:Protein kinase domain-containing protein n=1 Tax=Chlamydomonas schloesseri TaxID=2026947 RepID=A0A835T9V4_9CHLO|nr:hypothetical protein HYH02_010604 [Chlamydomonas schloesseri]KAG2439727.1 hypothetical protein HYH02_010605 [Chlamydomonas schloesseri]|eukprot:KAG2439726.1 hypothetical protein HYH02_010604 [Chlamydomonas schloesseri]